MFGLLNINKPAGKTSRDVVNHVQRLARPAKVGHAGTLDPLATGVLVVCVGPATRLIQYVQQMPKRYLATFQLGCRSDSDDTELELIPVAAPAPTRAAIQSAIPNFIAYRDKAFCSYGEQDAQSVAAALASYFSEPDHTQTPSVGDLMATEQLSTNNASASITIDETTTAGVTAIMVEDDSSRCPRSTEYFKTMGGEQGYWQ